MKKIVKFPISEFQRIRNRMGKGYVPCMVTDRWVQFPSKSAGHFRAGEFIEISIMTYSYTNNEPKKICDLILTREDLLKAINSVEDPEAES